MRKNRSQFASKRYPNLYKYPERSPHWVFRKYSKEKRKEFMFATDEVSDEARAYKAGVAEFDKWLGTYLPSGRRVQVKDLGRAVLATKESKRDATYRSAANQIQNHIIPAFGYLRPDQLTPLKWNQYVAEQRRGGKDRKFFNMRKLLMEILRRAHEERLIERVPRLENPDPAIEQRTYLDEATVDRILGAASPDTRLLAEIVYRMGSRPGEAIQYRYSMIRWAEGAHGTIRIPGSITKTGRARAIPLNSEISKLLRARMANSGTDLVFPSPTNATKPAREYKTGWRGACRRAKVESPIYALRDTFITNQLKRGKSSVFIGRYCDTSGEMIDRKYAKALPGVMEDIAG